jgi:enterochelin esterase-like enzyme
MQGRHGQFLAGKALATLPALAALNHSPFRINAVFNFSPSFEMSTSCLSILLEVETKMP